MTRQSTNKSELMDGLLRQAQKQKVEIDWLKAKIERAEKRGFTNDSREAILRQSKSKL